MILQNKRGLIFGAMDELSLAWHVAEKAVAEGAKIVLSNAPLAVRLGKVEQLSARLGAPLIEADATNEGDLRRVLEESQQLLGGQIDFVLHAVAMSNNLRRGRAYDNLSYNYFRDTVDVSAFSLHKLLQTAKKMDAIAEGGSVVALTYIASQRYVPNYGDMSNAKALLESIVRTFGAIYGAEKGVRINAVSQSPTKTTAGKGISGFQLFYDISNNRAPLGNANADDCADVCVMLFSDYTRKITMQTIYNDGGFSMMA